MFLHSLCYLSNQHWSWCLFCLFLLILKKKDITFIKFGTLLNGIALKQQFNECNSIELINGKSQTNRDQKCNLLFLQQQLLLKNLIQTY